MSESITPRPTKRGRPKYKSEHAETAYHLALLGGTNGHIAKALGVSLSAVEKWIAGKPEFAERVREGREVADGNVARSLYLRAIGYAHQDTVVTSHQGVVTLTPVIKHYPPDTRACELWLRFRRPSQWSDKKPGEEGTEADDVIRQAAERIMAADQEEFMQIMAEERAKISAAGESRYQAGFRVGTGTMSDELLARGGGSVLSSTEDKREFAGMMVRAHAKFGGDSEAPPLAPMEPERLKEGAKQIARVRHERAERDPRSAEAQERRDQSRDIVDILAHTMSEPSGQSPPLGDPLLAAAGYPGRPTAEERRDYARKVAEAEAECGLLPSAEPSPAGERQLESVETAGSGAEPSAAILGAPAPVSQQQDVRDLLGLPPRRPISWP